MKILIKNYNKYFSGCTMSWAICVAFFVNNCSSVSLSELEVSFETADIYFQSVYVGLLMLMMKDKLYICGIALVRVPHAKKCGVKYSNVCFKFQTRILFVLKLILIVLKSNLVALQANSKSNLRSVLYTMSE